MASAIPPPVMAKVASLSGMSGLQKNTIRVNLKAGTPTKDTNILVHIVLMEYSRTLLSLRSMLETHEENWSVRPSQLFGALHIINITTEIEHCSAVHVHGSM